MFDTAPPPDHALLQDPTFAAALHACGQRPITLPNGLIVLHRRLFGVPLTMLPRATPPPNLRTLLREAGLPRGPLILSPEVPCPNLRAVRLRAPVNIAQIDLGPDNTTRHAQLHGKWRNQLRRAEASALQICHQTFPPDHPLLQLDAAQAKSRHYKSWPTALTAAFAQIAPHQTRLFTASLRGAPIAHMLFLLHGARATYHIGYTTQDGRKVNAHNLLLWRATCWFRDHGVTTLDLGPLPAQTPTLNRFKLRAGAQPTPTGGTWLSLC